MRPDLPELAEYAVGKGMRAVISTNGTLITPKMAKTLKEIGLSYVGISLDGMQGINDKFRGVPGAYEKALDGIRNCQEAGIKVGLRFTINKFNVDEIPSIFDLLETMEKADEKSFGTKMSAASAKRAEVVPLGTPTLRFLSSDAVEIEAAQERRPSPNDEVLR